MNLEGRDVFDSRDLIEYLDELQDALPIDFEEEKEKYLEDDGQYHDIINLYEEIQDIETVIEGLGSEAKHGITLIRASYFIEYAKDFAHELGLMQKEDQWPYTCINWEDAADELKYDYSEIEIWGCYYYFRAY